MVAIPPAQMPRAGVAAGRGFCIIRHRAFRLGAFVMVTPVTQVRVDLLPVLALTVAALTLPPFEAEAVAAGPVLLVLALAAQHPQAVAGARVGAALEGRGAVLGGLTDARVRPALILTPEAVAAAALLSVLLVFTRFRTALLAEAVAAVVEQIPYTRATLETRATQEIWAFPGVIIVCL